MRAWSPTFECMDGASLFGARCPPPPRPAPGRLVKRLAGSARAAQRARRRALQQPLLATSSPLFLQAGVASDEELEELAIKAGLQDNLPGQTWRAMQVRSGRGTAPLLMCMRLRPLAADASQGHPAPAGCDSGKQQRLQLCCRCVAQPGGARARALCALESSELLDALHRAPCIMLSMLSMLRSAVLCSHRSRWTRTSALVRPPT